MDKQELIMTIARDLTIEIIRANTHLTKSHANKEAAINDTLETTSKIFEVFITKLSTTYSGITQGK